MANERPHTCGVKPDGCSKGTMVTWTRRRRKKRAGSDKGGAITKCKRCSQNVAKGLPQHA